MTSCYTRVIPLLLFLIPAAVFGQVKPLPVMPPQPIPAQMQRQPGMQRVLIPAGQEEKRRETGDLSDPLFDPLVPLDRNTQRRFEQAKKLIENDRQEEAAQLLGTILESAGDYFLPAPNDGSKDFDARRTSAQTFAETVLKTLRGLPGKARESYQVQYEAQANRLLDNAVQTGSIGDIQQIAKRYAPTKAGRTALFLLGMNQFEQGAFKPAMLTLLKLNSSPEDLTAFEPVLSLTLAGCQLRFGQKAEALQRAEQLFQRIHKPEIQLTGSELWKPEKPQDVVDKLSKMLEQTPNISPPAWLEQSGWQLPAGTADQNPETSATKPLLELIWSVPVFSRPQLDKDAKAAAGVVQRREGILLPAGQPLLVDGKVFYRGINEVPEIIAVDAKTGKRIWTAAEPEYNVSQNNPAGIRLNLPMIQRPRIILNNRMIGMGGQVLSFPLSMLLWHHQAANQFSSSGQRLYSVDGFEMQGMAFAAVGRVRQRIQVGNKTFEDPRFGPGNTLTARDIHTGRILWQAGKFPYAQKQLDLFLSEVEEEKTKKKLPDLPQQQAGPQGQIQQQEPRETEKRDKQEQFSEEELFLAETWFLGAPLPLHGRLYVLGENSGVIRLIVLDETTGRFLRQQPLAAPERPYENDWQRKLYALTPSEKDGIIICPTGAGMLFALDATTLNPLWCFSYLDVPADNDSEEQKNRRNQRRMFGNGFNPDILNSLSQSRWQFPSVSIDGNYVVFAPSEENTLYCFNLTTGKRQWKKTEFLPGMFGSPLYVAGIYNGTVYAATSNSMVALDLVMGQETKQEFPAFVLKPAGRGIRNGSRYFLPFSDGVLGVLDLDKGTLETTPPASGGTKSPNVELGNLIGLQDRFFSQNPLQVTCFDQLEPLKKRTDDLLEKNPNDAEGLYQLGRIKRSEGNLTAAADLFRRSMSVKRTEWAADALRRTLLDAIRQDYAAWNQSAAELESLAEFPEELGEILYVLACCAAQSGNQNDLFDKIRKAVPLGQDGSILVPVNSTHTAQLHTAFGILLAKNGSVADRLNEAAETLFNAQQTQPVKQPSNWLTDVRQEYEVSPLPQEIQTLRLLSTLFRSLPVAEKIDTLLLKKLERNKLLLAAELLLMQKEKQTPEQSKVSEVQHTPVVFPSGIVRVEDETPTGFVEQNDGRSQAIARILQQAGGRNLQSPMGRQNLPFYGNDEPFLSPYSFTLEAYHPDVYLVCSDSFGKEVWRSKLSAVLADMGEYGGISDFYRFNNNGFSPQTVYLTGCGHLLIFVHRDLIAAFDTSQYDDEHGPRVLWTKRSTAPLPMRQSYSAVQFGHLSGVTQNGQDKGFPSSPLFVSPNIVCYRDTNKIYGLDPLTGQTKWTREMVSPFCSLLGDRNRLFLVFPDIAKAAAVEPASGNELTSGTIPTGGIFTYGTNIVFVKQVQQVPGAEQVFPQQLHVCDLKDLFEKRRRALMIADNPEQGETPTLPSVPVCADLSYDTLTLIRQIDGRYIASASWKTKTVQMFDLKEKKNVWKDSGAVLPALSAKRPQWDSDFDIEVLGNQFLLTLVERGQMNQKIEEVDEDGVKIKRRRNVVNGVPCRQASDAMMMLYSIDGKTFWKEPAKIENWYRLLCMPEKSPVALFAVMFYDEDPQRVQVQSTALLAVDKYSGKVRFRKIIPILRGGNNQQFLLQGFKVEIDPAVKKLSFVAPQRTVNAVFTEQRQE
ncbi:MAG: PQQ-binding-like beta-propeller repeat protein [Planctomycetaceae bacterium]|jgi:outer membrane protein assembly factor BamB/thioredoxin-like negative regulator of GroEL|nr:PQQ-binding-like beta-propeller repeat protein [Planctomycetaceae bacterium]